VRKTALVEQYISFTGSRLTKIKAGKHVARAMKEMGVEEKKIHGNAGYWLVSIKLDGDDEQADDDEPSVDKCLVGDSD
jgi:hypothetical protein